MLHKQHQSLSTLIFTGPLAIAQATMLHSQPAQASLAGAMASMFSKQGECGCPGSVLGRRVSSGCVEYERNQPPWHPSVCPSGGGWGSHGSKSCLLAGWLALQWEAACCCGCSGCDGYSCRSPAPSLIARTPVQRPSMLERS